MLDPITSPVGLRDGIDHFRRGAVTEARLHYERALIENPKNFEALRLLGKLAMQTHSYHEAELLMERAIALRPECVQSHLDRGIALVKMKALDRATESFTHAIELDQKSAEGYLRLGQIHLCKLDFARAIELLKHANALKKEDPLLLAVLGQAWFRSGSQKYALRCFDTAIGLNPREPVALNGKGAVLAAEEDWFGAFDLFERSRCQAGEVPYLEFNLGNAYAALNYPVDALRLYINATNSDRQCAEAFLNRGNVLFSLNRRSQAMASYEMALTARPGWSSGEWNLGIVMLNGHGENTAADLYSCPCMV